MTAICGGGTSAEKAGFPLISAYAAGRLAQLMVESGMEWTNPYLPLVSLLPITATAFCSVDPPTITALTTAEKLALSLMNYSPEFFSGIGKIKDALLNVIWNDICECTSGAYVPPTYLTPTTGTPVLIQPTPGSSIPCYSFANVTNAIVGAPSTQNYGSLFPVGGQQPTLFTAQVTAATGAGYQYIIGFRINNGVTLTTYKLAGPFNAGVLANVNVPIPSGYIKQILFDVYHDAGVQSGTCNVTMSGQVWCNNVSPGVQLPCCPPDESTQAYLDQILRMVTLIQRQAVPFGYVTGTVHTGLTGGGSIAISGLMGASAHCTTIPSSYGRSGTNPTEYFDMGFLSFGAADGWPTSYRVDKETVLMLPARCGLYTDLEYDLAPGVVVTLTEILREP